MNRKQRRIAAKGTGGGGGAPGVATEAERLADAGRAHHQAGRLIEARDAYRQALRVDASSIDAVMNLGVVLAQLGCQAEAPRFLRQAIKLSPRDPMIQTNAGIMFAELGRWDEAVRAFERGIALAPRAPAAYENLGSVLAENGQKERAIAALQRAIALDPNAPAPYYRLHTALYDDRDLAPAAKALTEAVARDPKNVWYRLCLGVLFDLLGDAKGARQQFAEVNPDGSHRGALESWEYVKRKRTPATRFFGTTRETLHFGLDQARKEGLVVELGVRYGMSTRWIAERLAAGEKVHGFDSFQGLPETWHVRAEGSYSTHGELPEVPPSVELHVGLFGATLPPFLAAHASPAAPIRFLNVDCDLYSSTKTALDLAGGRIVPGTVLVFDEYIINDAWAEDEFKAFQEAVAARGWKYEYLAFSVQNCQAALRIVG